MNYSNSRVSQIVNEALDKARSGELGNDTAKCEHDATNNNNNNNNISTNNNNNNNMGEEKKGAATTNNKAAIIVSSRTISMTKDEFTSIILSQNEINRETLVVESSPAHLNNLLESNHNINLG